MAYSDKVLDHYENPRNVGGFDKGDDQVGTGMVGAPACGDVMKLQIRVNEAGIIEDARFKTYGCGSAIASSSLVTEWVKGKTLDEALTIRNTQIAEELALPPVKIHCSILAEDAIKAAVKDPKTQLKLRSKITKTSTRDNHGRHTYISSSRPHRQISAKAGQWDWVAFGCPYYGLLGYGVQAGICRRSCSGRSGV
ncbi:MAG: hypothetical protein RI904_2719 [Pseudomonadota bacterium]